MISPVSRSSAVELIRASSDQVRRAAQLMAEITDETAPADPAAIQNGIPLFGSLTPPGTSDAISRSLTTIMLAQRSFAAAVRVQRSLDDVEGEVLELDSTEAEEKQK